MNEAYGMYSDDLAIVALSPYDDAESIAAYKADNGLTFRMGTDDIGLVDKFNVYGFPTSVMIDRNGVYCANESTQLSVDPFIRFFDPFVSDDYTESLVGFTIPGPKSTVENPSDEELTAALGGELNFTCIDNEYVWPWLPSEDGKSLSPSNSGYGETAALVTTTIEAKAGDALCFDYRVSSESAMDFFTIYVNNDIAKVFSGEMTETSTYAISFDEDGTYEVIFGYEKDPAEDWGEDTVVLSNVRLLSGDEAAAAIAALPAYPKILAAREYALEVVSEDAKEIVILDPSGNFDLMFGSTPMYLVPSDTADFRVLLGEDLDECAAYAYGDYDNVTYALNTMECDEEGFLFSVLQSSIESGFYSNTYVTLIPDFSDYDAYDMVVTFKSEENVNYFCANDISDEYGNIVEGVTWMYVDGSKPSTDAVATFSLDESEGMSSYTLSFVDQDGNPVADVMANICDDNMCTPAVSDENGLIEFSYPSFEYVIHVLMVPNGYEFDTTQEFTVPAEGGELVFELTKAAE